MRSSRHTHTYIHTRKKPDYRDGVAGISSREGSWAKNNSLKNQLKLYTLDYHSTFKKKEILATWNDVVELLRTLCYVK